MDKIKLQYWKKYRDGMAYHHDCPSITFDFGNNCLYGKIFPNGKIQLMTEDGGGHGEGYIKNGSLDFDVWHNLLSEAEKVANYYWK